MVAGKAEALPSLAETEAVLSIFVAGAFLMAMRSMCSGSVLKYLLGLDRSARIVGMDCVWFQAEILFYFGAEM